MFNGCEIPRRGRIMLPAKSNAPVFSTITAGTKTLNESQKDMLLSKEKKFTSFTRLFEKDIRKHFVGGSETYEGESCAPWAMSSSSKTRRQTFFAKSRRSGLALFRESRRRLVNVFLAVESRGDYESRGRSLRITMVANGSRPQGIADMISRFGTGDGTKSGALSIPGGLRPAMSLPSH